MKQQHKGSRQQSGDNTRMLYQRPSGTIKPSDLRGDNSETERRGDNKHTNKTTATAAEQPSH